MVCSVLHQPDLALDPLGGVRLLPDLVGPDDDTVLVSTLLAGVGEAGLLVKDLVREGVGLPRGLLPK
jgi:hypothetical protein